VDSDGLLKALASQVKAELLDQEAGHDWSHTERVWKLTRYIAAKENLKDMLVAEAAALLHDIRDAKFNQGNEDIGPEVAFKMLKRITFPEKKAAAVVEVVEKISFRKGYEGEKSIELKIVQDADRLEAIGAIGIARAFHYGGYNNRKLFDDTQPLGTSESTIDHFHQKLLKLKDLMNTSTGKKLAEERHLFMIHFLSQFETEWRLKNLT
jgi:uncharacterized protein